MKNLRTNLLALLLIPVCGVSTLKAQTNSDVEEIIIVFKTHVDVGYTDLMSSVIDKYRTTTIDQALKVIDESRGFPGDQQFVWTLPGWPMKKILEDWPGQTPERQQRVKEAFEDGHFVTHALSSTTHTEAMEPELLVRSLGFSSDLARQFEKPLPTGAKMTDVPSHSWIMPTLLNNAGADFLHLGCNPASTFPELPYMFWWEGPDNSRILTIYTPLYGSKLLPPEDWPHKTWLAMLMRNDNQGPPSPDELGNILNTIKEKMPDVKVTVGELGDFSDRIIAENPSLPVVKGDMPDSWIHGIMCDPATVILSRETTPAAFAAESLQTLLGTWGVPVKNNSDIIRDVYENSLMFYEHTWGLALAFIAPYAGVEDYVGVCKGWEYDKAKWEERYKNGQFDRNIESWEEKSELGRAAHKAIMPLLKEEMDILAKSVNVPGDRTVVYNALPWEREGIPALGYKAYPKGKLPSKGKHPKVNRDKGTMENKFFKIELDPAKGAIRSVLDKRTGYELVDNKAEHGFGQLLHERVSRNEIADYGKAYVRDSLVWGYVEIGKPNMPSAEEFPYQALTPSDCEVELLQDGSGLKMIYEPEAGNLLYPVSTSVIMYGDAPYFDLEVTIDKPADPWPEAGWICLPFKVDNPQFRVGRNGSVVDPVRDFTIRGVNRHLFAVGSGVAVFDNTGAGVGVCGMDAPLVSLSEPGCYKFDKDYFPSKSYVYYNLYNNQWSTNFRLWNEGKLTYRFRVWSYDKYDTASCLITPSFEARYPLMMADAEGAPGSLPKEQTGVKLSREGVLVTAFGEDPDGNAGTLLRVWEQAGNAGNLTVHLPDGMKSKTAIPVNLRGETIGKPIDITSSGFEFELGAYAPASFILK